MDHQEVLGRRHGDPVRVLGSRVASFALTNSQTLLMAAICCSVAFLSASLVTIRKWHKTRAVDVPQGMLPRDTVCSRLLYELVRLLLCGARLVSQVQRPEQGGSLESLATACDTYFSSRWWRGAITNGIGIWKIAANLRTASRPLEPTARRCHILHFELVARGAGANGSGICGQSCCSEGFVASF